MKKFHNILKIVVRILGYLISLGLCVFFALYMSAAVGWTLFYVLAVAVIFSLVVTLITFYQNSISVKSDISSNLVSKGEIIKLTFTVKNKSFFPVPAVVISLKKSDGISFEAGEKATYIVSVQPKGSISFDVMLKAEMWGKTRVGAEKITMQDFLHFISLRLDIADDCVHEIKVIPNIPDVPSDTPLIKSAADTIRFAEECEDTREADRLNSFGGMPGYNHREYVEGDSLRRINWKLSSKKDSYMVRLDDEIEAMQQNILLDCVGISHSLNERAVEGLLSIVFSLLRLGFDSIVWYKTADGYTSFNVSEQGDLYALQAAFADYSFNAAVGADVVRIPFEQLEQKRHINSVMLFTSYPNNKLAAEIDAVRQRGLSCIVVAAAEVTAVPPPFWKIQEDYTAELIS